MRVLRRGKRGREHMSSHKQRRRRQHAAPAVGGGGGIQNNLSCTTSCHLLLPNANPRPHFAVQSAQRHQWRQKGWACGEMKARPKPINTMPHATCHWVASGMSKAGRLSAECKSTTTGSSSASGTLQPGSFHPSRAYQGQQGRQSQDLQVLQGKVAAVVGDWGTDAGLKYLNTADATAAYVGRLDTAAGPPGNQHSLVSSQLCHLTSSVTMKRL